MAFLQLTDVSLSFGARDILRSVAVYLKDGSKVALTGPNGAGKSTLIKVLAGVNSPDSGSVALEKGATIAYLPQSGLTHKGLSLLDEVDKAFDWGYKMQRDIDSLGESGTSSDLQKQATLIDALNNSTFPTRRAVIESTLLGLGFHSDDFGKLTETFSGGWQMRIALAKVLLQNADILLLDEPTNYLDIEARTYLEGFLQGFSGAFLIVSHDRYFLDVTINEVYELFNGDILKYKGNYTHYEEVRAVELETLQRQYNEQQAEITKLQDFINRFGVKATKAAQAQDRQKRLDKILAHPIIIPESYKVMHFTFPPCPHSPNVIVSIDNLCKSYSLPNGNSLKAAQVGAKGHSIAAPLASPRLVLHNLTLTISKGERVVVVGENGAGKSTLLRIIAGRDSDYSGRVTLGAGVKVGYFAQDSIQKITGSKEVIDFIESHAPMALIPRVRDMLGAFLFRGDDVYKTLDVLSGGEKTRLALLLLLLSENNLLILDEATNHLDMQSKDILCAAIKDYGGTVIFVSHDRSFMESLANKVIELSAGHDARIFPGDYEYYLKTSGVLGGGYKDPIDKSSDNITDGAPKVETNSTAALTYEEKKAQEAATRKKQKTLKALEDRIAALTAKKKEAEDSLALPAIYSSPQKAKEVQRKISDLTKQLEDLEDEWLLESE